MALTLPLNTETMYICNDDREFMLFDRDGDGENATYLKSDELDVWFEVKTGIAPGTEYKLVDQLPPPTLPLVEGRTYVTNDGQEITFHRTRSCGSRSIYSKECGLYFRVDTGKAPNTPTYVVAELLPESVATLKAEHADMMKRLKEMGAC